MGQDEVPGSPGRETLYRLSLGAAVITCAFSSGHPGGRLTRLLGSAGLGRAEEFGTMRSLELVLTVTSSSYPHEHRLRRDFAGSSHRLKAQ